ncbi:ribosomal protein L35Ae-domain-containing protein [Russula compacta]|nr:ribosomal protein L35Ae-domain-containing protein [Russula compacta]
MVNVRCDNLRCGGWTRLDQDDILGPPIQDDLCDQVLISCLSHRLYSKGRVLGHKRGKRNTRPNTSLLQIEGVANKEDAQFYLGKRVAYVYRAKRAIAGSNVRVIWGRVTRPHGNSGVVKSKFRSNLPPHAFGASVRIMLYPSNI